MTNTNTTLRPLGLNTTVHPDRRAFLIGAGLLVAMAGCSTMAPTGSGAGVSSSATNILIRARRTAGLPGLVPDGQLERTALQQAGYMASAKQMTHTTGWGKDFASRVKSNHIDGAAAENIAEGRMDITRLFEMWMNSSPHRRNILDSRFTRFGLAYVRDGKDQQWRYWALLLGK